MSDHHDVRELLAEIATAPTTETPTQDDLRRIEEALAADADFARETARTLLALRLVASSAPRFLPKPFTPPRARRPRTTWLWPVAALVLGLVAGRFLVRDDQMRPTPREGPTLVMKIEAPPCRLAADETPLRYRPHHYEGGFLAGKVPSVTGAVR